MIILDCEQGSEEWLEARKGIPTASRFSEIITPKKGDLSSSADGYIAELIAEQLGEEPAFTGNQWTERGQVLEPEARNWYEFHYALPVEQVGLILRDDRLVAASPDGLIGDNCGIEIKCPAPKTHIKWLIAGGLPDDHKAQVHGNMLLSEKTQWIFVSYCPGLTPLVVDVRWDVFTDKLANSLDVFIDKLVECKTRFLD